MRGMDFGTRLKHLRMEAHLSQRALAEMVGMDFSYLSRIETGALGYNLTVESIRKFVRALKVNGQVADELYLAAGRIPPDIERAILTTPGLLTLLRRKVGNHKG